MCSPCSRGHVDIFRVEKLNVFVFYNPKVEFYAFSWNQLVPHIGGDDSCAGVADTMPSAALAAVVVARLAVASSSDCCLSFRRKCGKGALRMGEKKKSIVALVAWGTSAARVAAVGFAGAAGAFCPRWWAARAEGLCPSSMLYMICGVESCFCDDPQMRWKSSLEGKNSR